MPYKDKDEYREYHRAYNKAYRGEHPEKNREWSRQYRERHPDKIKERNHKYYYRDVEATRAYHREKERGLFLKALIAYGGEHPHCQCTCGCVTDWIPYLTIDHINNDGAKHRREIGGSGGWLYRWLKKNNYPKGFQVLCRNCNWAKYKGGCK